MFLHLFVMRDMKFLVPQYLNVRQMDCGAHVVSIVVVSLIQCSLLKFSLTCIFAAVDCGNLDDIRNGRKIGTANTTLGFEVRFECNPCYELEGPTTRTCQANSTWSGTEPSCNSV